jgi:hypothetical protein
MGLQDHVHQQLVDMVGSSTPAATPRPSTAAALQPVSGGQLVAAAATAGGVQAVAPQCFMNSFTFELVHMLREQLWLSYLVVLGAVVRLLHGSKWLDSRHVWWQ